MGTEEDKLVEYFKGRFEDIDSIEEVDKEVKILLQACDIINDIANSNDIDDIDIIFDYIWGIYTGGKDDKTNK